MAPKGDRRPKRLCRGACWDARWFKVGLVRIGGFFAILGGLLLIVSWVFATLAVFGVYSMTALGETALYVGTIFALGLPLFAMGAGLAFWGLAGAVED